MSTALAERSDSQTTALSTTVFDRMDPLQFIDVMGKAFGMSGAGGCKNEQQGKVMALACLTERKNVFQIAREYHLIDGKLSIKSETMLIRFKKAGGIVKWINNGIDGKEARLELSKDGITVEYQFTIEMAKKAGYIKKDSNWDKRPDQMLRARCISDLIRMQWPEISDGDYTEEEVADIIETTAVVRSASSRSKVDVEKRAAELKSIEGVATSTVTNPTLTIDHPTTTETIVDVEAQVVDAEVEKAPFDVGSESAGAGADAISTHKPSSADSSFVAAVLEIESLIGQCRMATPTVLSKYNTQFGTSHADFGQFNEEHQAFILEKLRAVKEKIDRGELVIKNGVLMKA